MTINFDDPLRAFDDGENATKRIAGALRSCGVDAPASLFNEALNFARDGKLSEAKTRLQMLVCLDPDDADAYLLLAKVLAAQGKFSEAHSRYEEAVAAGALPPPGFRNELEVEIRREREESAAVASIEEEARQIGMEPHEKSARLWRWTACGIAIVAAVAIVWLWFLDHGLLNDLDALAKEKQKLERELADEVARHQASKKDVGALTAQVATLEADKKAALDRLDSDHDGVEIPADLCPSSSRVRGIDNNGCDVVEAAAKTCKTIRRTVPDKGEDGLELPTGMVVYGECTLDDKIVIIACWYSAAGLTGGCNIAG